MALRFAWVLLLVPVLLGCWLELLLVFVLMPFVLVARAAGLSWHLEIRTHGCRGGVVKVGSLAAARRLKRVLREHLGSNPGLDDSLLRTEHAEFTPLVIGEARWRLVARRLSPYGRRRWFLWRRRLSFEDAMDSLPGGLGDDPISAIIAIPFLLLAGVLLAGATLELVAQILVLPVIFLLRLCHLLPWPVELVRENEVETREKMHGMLASVRARRALTAEHALRPPLPSLRPQVPLSR